MQKTRVDTEPPRTDRVTMRIIALLTLTMAVALAAGQVVAAARYLWASSLSLSLLTEASVPFTPGLGVSAAVVETALVTTDSLSPGARWFFACSSILLAFTALTVGFALSWLVFAASTGRPFRTALYRSTLVAAFALVLGPLLASASGGFASMQAAFDLEEAMDGALIPGWTMSGWGFAIPIVGLGLIALAYLFRRMQTLQRDMDGLV